MLEEHRGKILNSPPKKSNLKNSHRHFSNEDKLSTRTEKTIQHHYSSRKGQPKAPGAIISLQLDCCQKAKGNKSWQGQEGTCAVLMET